MGNSCLKSSGSVDDLALLRESNGSSREPSSSEPQLGPPPSYQETIQQMSLPIFYPQASASRPSTHMTEEEQIKIAQKLGLIQHLPSGLYDSSKKDRECAICMCDFVINDSIRFLPCMHIYHTKCIDDWLMRSFTCPSCLEPVDCALLQNFTSN